MSLYKDINYLIERVAYKTQDVFQFTHGLNVYVSWCVLPPLLSSCMQRLYGLPSLAILLYGAGVRLTLFYLNDLQIFIPLWIASVAREALPVTAFM